MADFERRRDRGARDVVVIGGGLAGWLAAIALLARAGEGTTRVVMAPTIPLIGVGESSTGTFADFLRRHRISTAAFLSGARATFKLGTEHIGWVRQGHRYLGPIDNPDVLAGLPMGLASAVSQRAAVADGNGVADAHLHAWLMRLGRVPAVADDGAIALLGTNAWHFDAGRAAAFAESEARARGAEAVLGEVVAVDRHADGSIRALRFADGRSLQGDFFVDCSGQRRLLMDRDRPDWTSQNERVLVDRAVAGFRGHDAAIAPATRAIAAAAGWIWEIPTQDRIGIGYVHSAAAIDLDQAWSTLRSHAGPSFEPGPTLHFSPGYRRNPWQQNGVAVGLASGFCEPLESTSLHLALTQIGWIVGALNEAGPRLRQWSDQARAYNSLMSAFQEDLADFIALHYTGSCRPTPFWREAAVAGRGSDLYRNAFLASPTFPPDQALRGRSGGLSPNLVLPVADGLGLLSRTVALRSVTQKQRAAAARARQLHRRYVAGALSHQDALQGVVPRAEREFFYQSTGVGEKAHESI